MTLADLLGEYAAAVRGDWSDFNGDVEAAVMERFADMIRSHGAGPLTMFELRELRDYAGLCPDGGGHWKGSECDRCG